MRMSDWSSDVCSSDLIAPIDADQHLAFGRAPDHTVRRGRLDRDARQLRGGVDQRFERQIDPRRDDPAQIGAVGADMVEGRRGRSEEHTSELQSLMRISYAVFCLKKKKNTHYIH